MGGNRINKIRQVGSLFLSFAFVSYWHGYEMDVTLWSIGNFLMVVCEMIFFNFIVKNQRIALFVS